VKCPKCGRDIVVKKTKKGRKYYGCEAYPECDFMVWQRPAQERCEKCGYIMFKKGNNLVCASEQCGFTKKIENK
jgi:DNA topoisomerase-1